MLLQKINSIRPAFYFLITLLFATIFFLIFAFSNSNSTNIVNPQVTSPLLVSGMFTLFMLGLVTFCIFIFRLDRKELGDKTDNFQSVALNIWLFCVFIFIATLNYSILISPLNQNESSNTDITVFLLLLLVPIPVGCVAYFSMLMHDPKILKISTKDSKNINKVTSNSDKIEDLLFVPKKKQNKSFIYFLIFLLFLGSLVFFLFLLMNPSSELPTNDVINNNKINKLSALSIENIDSDWAGNLFYIKGTIKNNSPEIATNVTLRADFYKDKENKNLFDTRYLKINSVSQNGAFTFREPLQINAQNRFWYTVTIYSTD